MKIPAPPAGRWIPGSWWQRWLRSLIMPKDWKTRIRYFHETCGYPPPVLLSCIHGEGKTSLQPVPLPPAPVRSSPCRFPTAHTSAKRLRSDRVNFQSDPGCVALWASLLDSAAGLIFFWQVAVEFFHANQYQSKGGGFLHSYPSSNFLRFYLPAV